MDPRAHHRAAALDGTQRRGNQRTHRSEDDRAIQPFRGRLIGTAGPGRAQFACKCLGPKVTWTGEGIDVAPLPACHLRDDVRRSTEAVQAQTGASPAMRSER